MEATREPPDHIDRAATATWHRVSAHLDQLKATLAAADRSAIDNRGVIPEQLALAATDEFNAFSRLLEAEIGQGADLPPQVKDSVGRLAHREFLPALLLTKVFERAYSKPRGYAGDYLTIDWIYEGTPGGAGRIGPFIDSLFLNEAPARAVRNRRELMVDRICSAASGATASGPVRVTSLACGPAREVFDVFEQGHSELQVTLVDHDYEALALACSRRPRKLEKRIDLVPGNLVQLVRRARDLSIPPQDLIYSIGLIDYFNDEFVVRLMNWCHERLRPGGKIILGNFHPRNYGKSVLDYVLDWRLIHRTEDDLNRLYEMSRFGRPCTDITFEAEGINLFAECVKE